MFEQPFLAIPFKNTSKAVTVLVAELPPEAAVSTNEALPSTHAWLSQATVLIPRRAEAPCQIKKAREGTTWRPRTGQLLQ